MGGIHCFAIAKKVASRGIHSFAKAKKATLTKNQQKRQGIIQSFAFRKEGTLDSFCWAQGRGKNRGNSIALLSKEGHSRLFFTLFKEGTLGVVLHPFKKGLGLVFCAQCGFIRATFLVKARDAPPRSWMATLVWSKSRQILSGGEKKIAITAPDESQGYGSCKLCFGGDSWC